MALFHRKPKTAQLSKPADGRNLPPLDHGLEEIAAWEAWFRNAHEELLRDWPDPHLIEQRRADVDALANAITAERRAAYLARQHQ
jgi:hypothetical protein